MRILLTALVLTGLTGAVFADEKQPGIAGVYKGVVQGDEARAILKADGSMVVYPSPDEPKVVMRGQWTFRGDTVIAKLAHGGGDAGTAVFERDGADLILVKLISPDGEVDELTAPVFDKKKALAPKGPAGVYQGEFDRERLQVELKPEGKASVRSAEDPAEGEIYSGTWKATETGAVITVKTECGEGAQVSVQFTERGFKIRKVDSADGVQTYEDGARLKRQKKQRNPKKDKK